MPTINRSGSHWRSSMYSSGCLVASGCCDDNDVDDDADKKKEVGINYSRAETKVTYAFEDIQ